MAEIPVTKEGRILFHLSWMLAEMDHRNEDCMDAPDSPEVRDLRELIEELSGR